MTKTVQMDTSKGTLRIELDDDKAPASVANFLAYVAKGHYDGTVFHRVIKGFMVQGGGFEPGMKQRGTDAPIRNEAGNGLKNRRHTLAMARTGDPHSATRSSSSTPSTTTSSTFAASRRRAGATPCSAASSTAPRSSTRSRPCPPGARACTTTCRWRTCASSAPSK